MFRKRKCKYQYQTAKSTLTARQKSRSYCAPIAVNRALTALSLRPYCDKPCFLAWAQLLALILRSTALNCALFALFLRSFCDSFAVWAQYGRSMGAERSHCAQLRSFCALNVRS